MNNLFIRVTDAKIPLAEHLRANKYPSKLINRILLLGVLTMSFLSGYMLIQYL